jgi:stage II sporulation protein AA (anti-sigma F factor antagonist)
MEVKIENRPEGLYVRLCGEIDHHSARKIREQVDSAIEMFRPAKLCLDFKEVSFMDSSGIGLIMGRYRLIQLYQGSLEIINISERIKKVVSLSGIDRLDIKIRSLTAR